MTMEYKIIRSSRKTIAIQLTPAGEILVRCPSRMKKADIDRFVASKQGWIEAHLTKLPTATPKLTAKEIKDLAARAKADLPARTARFAPLIGVTYGRITIRSQRTRWGSCSNQGNLNFNCLLMLTPPEIRDYVVVHELCHRIELNHSARFWSLVETIIPDYRSRRNWLRENGNALIAALPESD